MSESATRSLPNQPKNGKSYSEFKIIQPLKAVLTDATLKPTERLMLSHLMLSAGEAGETSWFHKNLARAIGISDRQSQRITANLDERGFLRSIQLGHKRANRYLMPWHSGFSDTTPVTCHKVCDTTSMSVPEATPVTVHEATPMSVPYIKESFLKDLEAKDTSSSSSSVPPEVPRRAEEDEEEVIVSSSKPKPRTDEDLKFFGLCLHSRMKHMGLEKPPAYFVQQILDQAPTWTADEAITAIDENDNLRRCGRRETYSWFKAALKNLYEERKGIPPELPKDEDAGPLTSSEGTNPHVIYKPQKRAGESERYTMSWKCQKCQDTGFRIDNLELCECPSGAEEPIVKEPPAPKCEHCKDTGEFPKGSTCMHECAAGKKRRSEIHQERWYKQSGDWGELLRQQTGNMREYMNFKGALDFNDVDLTLDGRDALLKQIADGKHPIQRAEVTTRMPASMEAPTDQWDMAGAAA